MAARLDVDQHPPGVQRIVGAIDPDIGRDAGDIRILGQRLGQLVLQGGHASVGDGLRRLGHPLQQAGILGREQALGDDDVEQGRDRQGGDGHDQGRHLAVQHPLQSAVVAIDDGVEDRLGAFGELGVLSLVVALQPAGGQGWHQGQRDQGRDDDGHRQGDGELAEQPADHVAHEKQRDQHRDQRHGQRDDGEADLLGALQRGGERLLALLDVARDVLDHHDGVVDDEACRDGQRHQGQVVEAVVQQVHHAECAHERQRHRDAGDEGRRPAAQEDEDHRHHEQDRQHQLELDIMHRGADRGGAVGQHRDLDAGRQALLQRRQGLLDLVDGGDDVGAGLALDVEDDRRLYARLATVLGLDRRAGAQLAVFRRADGCSDVLKPDRRARLIGDDQVHIVVGGLELVVGVDRERAAGSVERALGPIGVGVADRRAQALHRQPIVGQRPAVDLDAHGRPLAAADADQADAGDLGNLLGQL